MKSELDAIDTFVDDLISTDTNLLKGELDILIMQHMFNTINLGRINKSSTINNDSIAA